MYIEWQLPRDNTYIVRIWIHAEVMLWSEQHNIRVRFKTVKYTYRLILNSDEDYTFFALTFNPKIPEWQNYSIKDPMNIDRNR
jgi:hypothetical protein